MTKAKKTYLQTKKNSKNIPVYKSEYELKEESRKRLNKKIEVFSNKNISFDWVLCDEFNDGTGFTGVLYKSWKIHFDRIHEKYIPNIKTEVLMKKPINSFPDTYEFHTTTRTVSVLDIEKVRNSNNFFNSEPDEVETGYISCDIVLTIYIDYSDPFENESEWEPINVEVKPLVYFNQCQIMYDKSRSVNSVTIY